MEFRPCRWAAIIDELEKKLPAKDISQNRHWVLQTPWFVEIVRNKTEIITFIASTISIDNRVSSYWRCLHGVGGHVSPPNSADLSHLMLLRLEQQCCDSPSWGYRHCAHQTSKGGDATFCIKGNPVQVNESESWEVQAARMMCVSLVYAGISWQSTVLLPKKMAFASGHSQFSGLSHVLLFFLFYGNFCPCFHSISWEIHKIRGYYQVILFTALHLHERKEHQYICMTSTFF